MLSLGTGEPAVRSSAEGNSRPCSRSLREHGPRSCSLSGVGREQSDSGVRETHLGLNCLPTGCLPLDPGIPDPPASVSPSAQHDYYCSKMIEP